MDIKFLDCPFCSAPARKLMGYDYHKVSCCNEYCPVYECSFSVEKWNHRHVTEGCAIVPVEPTVNMVEASLEENDDPDNYWGSAEALNARIYKAMIKAAQESSE